MDERLYKLAKQFFKYFLTGGVAALVEWAVFFVCNDLLLIHYLVAVLISFVLATFVNYIISIKFVFERGKHHNAIELLLVFFVSFLGLLMNLLLMYIFVSRFSMYPFFAKVLSTGIVFLWNFISRKLWVFKS